MSSIISQIKARINLVDEVKRLTKLTRVGDRFKGCCPLHEEQTPSFYVSPKSFNCYGCGAKGDVINFYQELHGFTVSEVIKFLRDGTEGKSSYQPESPSLKRPTPYEIRVKACRSRLPMNLLWIQLLADMSPQIKKDLAPRIALARESTDEINVIRTMLELPSTTAGTYEALIAYELLCDQWDGNE